MPPSTTINPTIARLAALCDESGLTRADIARRAEILPNTLYRILRGEFTPSVDSVGSILDAIDRKWADLD